MKAVSVVRYAGYVLAAGAVYAIARNIAADCSSCGSGQIADYLVPAAGLVFYVMWGAGFLHVAEKIIGVLLHFGLIWCLKPSCPFCVGMFLASSILVMVELAALYGFRVFTVALLALAVCASVLHVRMNVGMQAGLKVSEAGSSLLSSESPSGHPSSRGTFLVVYMKRGCQFCEKFDKEYAPKLSTMCEIRREFENIPAEVQAFPTIVIMNHGEPRVYVGLPELHELVEAIKS